MQLLAGTSRGVYGASGDNWRHPVELLASGSVRELVRIGTRTFAGTSSGVQVSTDDGATWQSGGLDAFAIWQLRRFGPDRLLAGTQPAGLFVADTSALNWTAIDSFNDAPESSGWCVPVDPPLPAAARAIVVDATDPSRICAGVEVGGIMRSEDGGGHWQLVLPGGNPDLHMLFQHPAEPDVLFASTGYGRLDGIAPMEEGNAGVFRSADFGRTWAYRWRGIEPRYARPMCIDHRPPYGLTVASAPTAFSSVKDRDGAGAMLFRSDDEGITWRSLCDVAHTPSRGNFHGLTIDPERTGGVIVGTDSGEIWRVSETAEWTLLASGLSAVRALCAWH